MRANASAIGRPGSPLAIARFRGGVLAGLLALAACTARRDPTGGTPAAAADASDEAAPGDADGARLAEASGRGRDAVDAAARPFDGLHLSGPAVAELVPKASPYRKQYEWTRDAFTQNVAVWQKVLEPYAGREDLRYLEVGLFEGRSAIWMLENVLTHPSSRLVGIDPFDDPYGVEGVEARFYANLEKSGAAKRVQVIKGYSQLELRKLPLESFDIIYIDGSHDAPDVLEDAVLAHRLLKAGGMLMFDDYTWNLKVPLLRRPEAAIEAFAFFFGGRLEVVHAGYQVMMKRRPEPSP